MVSPSGSFFGNDARLCGVRCPCDLGSLCHCDRIAQLDGDQRYALTVGMVMTTYASGMPRRDGGREEGFRSQVLSQVRQTGREGLRSRETASFSGKNDSGQGVIIEITDGESGELGSKKGGGIGQPAADLACRG